jgi:hypothetical protein
MGSWPGYITGLDSAEVSLLAPAGFRTLNVQLVAMKPDLVRLPKLFEVSYLGYTSTMYVSLVE